MVGLGIGRQAEGDISRQRMALFQRTRDFF